MFLKVILYKRSALNCVLEHIEFNKPCIRKYLWM